MPRKGAARLLVTAGSGHHVWGIPVALGTLGGPFLVPVAPRPGDPPGPRYPSAAGEFLRHPRCQRAGQAGLGSTRRAGCQPWGGCPAGPGTGAAPVPARPWRLAGGLGVGCQPQAPGRARRAGVGWRIQGVFLYPGWKIPPLLFLFFFPSYFFPPCKLKRLRGGAGKAGAVSRTPSAPRSRPGSAGFAAVPGAARERLRRPPGAHCSGLGFSRELFSFFSVFLIRRAVRRAEGLWYQHSFMTFASADKTWGRPKKRGGKWKGFVGSKGLARGGSGAAPRDSPSRRRGGWGPRGSADRHTPPSSCPRSWGRWGRRRRRAAGTPPRCLRAGGVRGGAGSAPHPAHLGVHGVGGRRDRSAPCLGGTWGLPVWSAPLRRGDAARGVQGSSPGCTAGPCRDGTAWLGPAPAPAPAPTVAIVQHPPYHQQQLQRQL